MELETECDFRLESDDFNLNQVVESAVNWASNPISPNMEPTNVTHPSSEPSSSLELKALPAHLYRRKRDFSCHYCLSFK